VELSGGERQRVEAQLKSTNRCSKTAQIFLMQNEVKEVLGKLPGGSSGQLRINKILNVVGHWYFRLHARSCGANSVASVQHTTVLEPEA
jgi:hypothetical protein